MVTMVLPQVKIRFSVGKRLYLVVLPPSFAYEEEVVHVQVVTSEGRNQGHGGCRRDDHDPDE